DGRRGDVPLRIELTLQENAGKRAVVNGATLRSADQLRSEVSTLVFTPDRLSVVKGGPIVRRAYFDRALGRFAPAKAPLPAEYANAVAQRNAALRGGSRDAVRPWTEQVALLGARLVEARAELLAALAAPFAERAGELGLRDATLRYQGDPPTV